MSQIASPPSEASLIEQDASRPERRDPFYTAKVWLIWILESLLPRVQASTQVLLTADESRLELQAAAIPTTALNLGNLPAGTYRISYFARKTRIDGVASALTVTIGWTDPDGSAQILSGPAMATDTTTSPQAGAITISIADNSPITIATVYVSTTPGQMRYTLETTVEGVS